jgi:hypothetical protein
MACGPQRAAKRLSLEIVADRVARCLHSLDGDWKPGNVAGFPGMSPDSRLWRPGGLPRRLGGLPRGPGGLPRGLAESQAGGRSHLTGGAEVPQVMNKLDELILAQRR